MKEKRKKPKTKKTQSSSLRLYGRALRLWWQRLPRLMSSCLLITIFQGLIPFVTLAFQSRLIAVILSSRDVSQMARLTVLLLSSVTVLGALAAYFKYQKRTHDRSVWFLQRSLFADAFLDMSYANFADPDVRAQFNKIEQVAGWAGLGLIEVYFSFQTFCETALQILLSIAFSIPLLLELTNPATLQATPGLFPGQSALFFLLFLALSILSPLISAKATQKYYQLSTESTAANRSYSWVFSFSTPEEGMESRIYRQSDYALNFIRNDQIFAADGILDRSLRGPIGRLQALSHLVHAIAIVLSYLYIGTLAWAGTISIASVSKYLGVLAILNGGMQTLIFTLGKIRAQRDVLQMTFDVLDLAEPPQAPTPSPSHTKAHSPSFHEIQCRHLSFTYPGTDRKVLDDLNLTIREGETLAIVGRNGSGKSTFVKLLCRLYDPDSGDILIDGTPLRDLPPQQLRQTLSIVFQDSKVLSYSLGENVSSGPLTDPARVQDCLRDAGFDLTHAPQFKRGLDTPLQKNLDKDGVLVSGGEEQKITIARALYDGGSLLVLDEPTAALDPLAEAEIYARLNEIIRDKSAIFISHRLSSCRFSDRILVFDEGRVVEEGTHDALLAQGGLYHDLWQAQAQYYAAEASRGTHTELAEGAAGGASGPSLAQNQG